MTPHQAALAYRLWAYAKPLGWDCTLAEAAEALNCLPGDLGAAVKARGWSGRLRSTQPYFRDVRPKRFLPFDLYIRQETGRPAPTLD